MKKRPSDIQAQRKASKLRIAQRRRDVAELYVKNVSQWDIAKKLGTTQSTVSKDIKIIHKYWLESTIVDFNKVKVIELRKIDKIERENWEQWELSKQDYVKKITKSRARDLQAQGGTVTPDEIETTTQTIIGKGDTKYMDMIKWCIIQREKIIGYGAATKVDLTTNGKDLEAVTIVQLPPNGRELIDAVTEGDNEGG